MGAAMSRSLFISARKHGMLLPLCFIFRPERESAKNTCASHTNPNARACMQAHSKRVWPPLSPVWAPPSSTQDGVKGLSGVGLLDCSGLCDALGA